MDLWYKQEADEQAKEILELRARIKRAKKTILLQGTNLSIMQGRIRAHTTELERRQGVIEFQRALIAEIFDRFQIVRDDFQVFFPDLQTEEEIMDSTDDEQ